MKQKSIDPETLDSNMENNAASEEGMKWYNPYENPFRLSGFPWFETDRIYRRLPADPCAKIPGPVDELANCTSGGQVSFKTDSSSISVRIELTGPAGMVHMPATGQCGVDIYIGESGSKKFYTATKYPVQDASYEIELFSGEKKMREITLNFPLYQGVKSFQVGLKPEAGIEPPEPFVIEGCIAVYGSSITQGGCASRPGMSYTNILSRKINVKFINLGFSGNGRGEPELAQTIATISNPVLFILDYEANCVSTELYKETLPPFISILRESHSDVPVLVVSRIRFAAELQHEESLKIREERLEFQKGLVSRLQNEGDKNIHFCDGSVFLGKDFDECTVDGSHPTDLGFLRMAEGLVQPIRDILKIR